MQRVNGFHLKRYICPDSSSESTHQQSPSKIEDPTVCAFRITPVRDVNGVAILATTYNYSSIIIMLFSNSPATLSQKTLSLHYHFESEDSTQSLPPPMPPKDLSTNPKNDAPKIKDEMNGIGTSTPSSKAAKFFSCSIDEQPSPICAPRTQSVKPTNAGAKNLFLKRRQKKPTNHVNREDPICVETYNMPDKSSKQWIPALGLSSSDRNRLLSPASWLTDSSLMQHKSYSKR